MNKSIILAFLSLVTFQTGVFSQNTAAGSPKVGLNVGDIAPELKFKSPDGKEIALSSLKGKLVLIDFWAAWCRPCRYENPNVVAAYNKYKDSNFTRGSGFTVYGVSLDNAVETWKSAIQQDGLIWENHVCDFGGWNSAASAVYGVRSIPANWLIDGKGIILGTNLRGPALEQAIQQYVVK